MNNQQTQKDNEYLIMKKNIDIRDLIREIVKRSNDQIIKKQTRGWWPRLVRKALESYLAQLKAGKE